VTGKACWVLSNGRAGTENQCVGLAEAVGLPFVVKQVRVRPPWRWLPPRLWFRALRALDPDSDPLGPPWPDLVIACGRTTEAVALAIRKESASGGKRAFVVYLQRPSNRASAFDLLAPPRHDRVRGDNVVETRGALHRVTPERLAEGTIAAAPLVQNLPRPLIAVLAGGTGNAYRMTEDAARTLGGQIRRLTEKGDVGLAVTVSRRTGAVNEQILRQELEGTPTFFWDGRGDNPYFGFLGLADAIVVTADSVSMVSEACSTGKPVYVAEIPGGSAKFQRFHAGLRSDGATRPFAGTIENWSSVALDDTAHVAAVIRDRLNLL
jgi:hypothetical protein